MVLSVSPLHFKLIWHSVEDNLPKGAPGLEMAFSGFRNSGNPSRCGGEGELYLQHFCRAEDTFNPVLVEVGHAAVHELQKDLQVLVSGAIQDDNQLSIERGVLEQFGEVGAAGGEDQPVCLEGLA